MSFFLTFFRSPRFLEELVPRDSVHRYAYVSGSVFSMLTPPAVLCLFYSPFSECFHFFKLSLNVPVAPLCDRS